MDKSYANGYCEFKAIAVLSKLGFDIRSRWYYKRIELHTTYIKYGWYNFSEKLYDKGFDKIRVGNRTITKYYSLDHKDFRSNFLAKTRNRTYKSVKLFPKLSRDQLVKAYQESKMLGLVSQAESRTAYFDIDCKIDTPANRAKAEKIVYLLWKKFKFAKPIVVEKGEGGGWHIGWYLRKKVDDHTLRGFQDNFKAKFGTIEVRTTTKGMRVPGSYNYTIGTLAKNKRKLIFTSFKNIGEIFDDILAHKDAVKLSVRKDVRKYKEGSIFTRIYQTEHPDTKDLMSDYPMIAGHRTGMMIKLGFACHLRNKSFDVYHNAVIANNINSKDVSNWSSDRLLKECVRLYKWTEQRVKRLYLPSTDPDEFKSNMRLLSDKEKTRLNILARKMPRAIYEKNRAKQTEVLALLLKEVVGLIKFNEINPRKIIRGARLTKAKRTALEVGIMVPRVFLKRFKDYYDLDYIDVNKLFVLIVKSGILRQYKHNRLGYNPSHNAYSFCRQWLLSKSDTISSINYSIRSISISIIHSTIRYTYSYLFLYLYVLGFDSDSSDTGHILANSRPPDI